MAGSGPEAEVPAKAPASQPEVKHKQPAPPQQPTNAPAGVDPDLLPKGEDLLYEEELLRNPYALKMWWRYIQARSDASAKRRYLLYERALRALPGSYKVCGCTMARAAAPSKRRVAGVLGTLGHIAQRHLLSAWLA